MNILKVNSYITVICSLLAALFSTVIYAQTTPMAPVTSPAQAQLQAQNPSALPMQGVPDHQLNRRVHEQLRNVRTYEPTNFTVFSQGGFVTIQGRARNSDEANAVIEEARKVSGVNNVINHIVIDPNM